MILNELVGVYENSKLVNGQCQGNLMSCIEGHINASGCQLKLTSCQCFGSQRDMECWRYYYFTSNISS